MKEWWLNQHVHENNILGEQTQAFLFSSLAIFFPPFSTFCFLFHKVFIIKIKYGQHFADYGEHPRNV